MCKDVRVNLGIQVCVFEYKTVRMRWTQCVPISGLFGCKDVSMNRASGCICAGIPVCLGV